MQYEKLNTLWIRAVLRGFNLERTRRFDLIKVFIPNYAQQFDALFLSYLVHFSPPTILYSYCEGVIFFVRGYFLEICEHLSPILHNLEWCGKVNRNTNIALKSYNLLILPVVQVKWAWDHNWGGGEIRASSKINGRENGSRKSGGAQTEGDCKTERVRESSQ